MYKLADISKFESLQNQAINLAKAPQGINLTKAPRSTGGINLTKTVEQQIARAYRRGYQQGFRDARLNTQQNQPDENQIHNRLIQYLRRNAANLTFLGGQFIGGLAAGVAQ